MPDDGRRVANGFRQFQIGVLRCGHDGQLIVLCCQSVRRGGVRVEIVARGYLSGVRVGSRARRRNHGGLESKRNRIAGVNREAGPRQDTSRDRSTGTDRRHVVKTGWDRIGDNHASRRIRSGIGDRYRERHLIAHQRRRVGNGLHERQVGDRQRRVIIVVLVGRGVCGRTIGVTFVGRRDARPVRVTAWNRRAGEHHRLKSQRLRVCVSNAYRQAAPGNRSRRQNATVGNVGNRAKTGGDDIGNRNTGRRIGTIVGNDDGKRHRLSNDRRWIVDRFRQPQINGGQSFIVQEVLAGDIRGFQRHLDGVIRGCALNVVFARVTRRIRLDDDVGARWQVGELISAARRGNDRIHRRIKRVDDSVRVVVDENSDRDIANSRIVGGKRVAGRLGRAAIVVNETRDCVLRHAIV